MGDERLVFGEFQLEVIAQKIPKLPLDLFGFFLGSREAEEEVVRVAYILEAPEIGIAGYNAPGKLDRGISYKAVSEPRRKERAWRHSATTTVPSSKPRWRSKR